jgi:hypothetical protein
MPIRPRDGRERQRPADPIYEQRENEKSLFMTFEDFPPPPPPNKNEAKINDRYVHET